jgi:iron complex outermembrane receptor protein
MDGRTGEPIPEARVRLLTPSGMQTTTDLSGEFQIGLVAGPAELEASRQGYETERIMVDGADSAAVAIFNLQPRPIPVPPVEVTTTRATERGSAVAFTDLDRKEIQQRYWAQDVPMLLAETPGVYSYSDAGNGIGYSYVKIRGFPQRRVAVTINGIPLNDPESHEVYWIDHPDLLSSTSEVQLQRGVGAAIYGAASVGGSVNLETAPFGETPRVGATLAYGSFNTRRTVLEMDSGRLAGGWNLYGRYSRIQTDGYRDQSWTKLWSYALSARRLVGNHAFRVNLYGGPEETHLAYLGVSSDYLNGLVTGDRDRDRRFNPITYAGEADHFFEPHYELIHSWSPRPGLALSQTLFYFDGQGFYDERRLGEFLPDYRVQPWQTNDPTLFGADSMLYYRTSGSALERDAQGRLIGYVCRFGRSDGGKEILPACWAGPLAPAALIAWRLNWPQRHRFDLITP